MTDSPTGTRLRRVWLGALAAYFLLGSAWALALPVNATYDEKQHIVRAYAVADGQLFPTGQVREETFLTGEAFRVPGTLLPGDPHCVWYPKPAAASCQTPATDPAPRLRASGAARYNPLYYLPVGVPMLLSPDRYGVIGGRLVSALLSALLLASAVVTAVRIGNRALVLAVALVNTPLVMALNGSINPNGLEVAAGVLLFTTLLTLLRTPPDSPSNSPPVIRRLLWLAGLSLVLLFSLRTLGPVLALLAVGTCALLAEPNRVRALLARRDARWILGGATVLGVGIVAVWTFASQAAAVVTEVSDRAEQLTGGELVRQLITHRIPFYVYQVIAEFGYGETHVSPLVTVAWYAMLSAFVLAAWRAGWRQTDRWRVGGRRLVLVSVGLVAVLGALLVGLDAAFVDTVGWVAHGRYVLPAVAGVVIAAAFWLPARRRLWWIIVGGATLPLHGYAFTAVLVRYRSGPGSGLNPFAGSWTPALGVLPPLLLCLAGAGAIAWLAVSAGTDSAGIDSAGTGSAGIDSAGTGSAGIGSAGDVFRAGPVPKPRQDHERDGVADLATG